MSFLYPGFLFALFAVAIPVIIHLFNFRRFKKIYFSNVKFLKEVEEQNSSREKLKNLLILFARILTIAFLVLAFAQPYISSSNNDSATSINVVSIYVDNSFSMEAANKDGSLLDEAKRKAAIIVKGFGLNDRFQLLTNEFNGKDQRLIDREEFLTAIQEVQISPVSRKLQNVLNLQARTLKGSGNKSIYLLSDFQTNLASQKPLSVNTDVTYTAIIFEPNNLPNIAVDSVYFLSQSHQPGASEKLVVVVKNYSAEEAKNVPIKLTVNDTQKGIASLTLGKSTTLRDTLNFSGLNAGWQKGLITVRDNPVNFDDSLFFSFNVENSARILAINGNGLSKTLAALYGADGYFKLSQTDEGSIDYNSFSSYKLIILNELKGPSSGLASQLKTYVQNGGSVMILPLLSDDFSIYNSFLSNLALPTIQKLDTVSTKIDKVDFINPIFKTVFSSVPKNVDLPIIYRHFNYTERTQISSVAIMKFANGTTFLGDSKLGSGTIYLAGSGFNPKDGNLETSSVFIPIMYRAALVNNFQPALFYTVGQEQALLANSIVKRKNDNLKLYSKEFEVIPELREVEGKTLIYVADQLKQSGFYDLKLSDSLLSVFGFNNDRIESEMKYLTKAQIASLLPNNSIQVYDAENDLSKFSFGRTEIAYTLWKLCIILSLVFMAVELLLIKFGTPKTKSTI